MSQTSYWAHSGPDSEPEQNSGTGWQLLSVHLEAVSRMARELASATRPLDANFAELAAMAGLLHDFGKYSDCFQKMLQTGKGRCQHAIHGAMLAYFGADGAARKPGLNTVAAAIAGHHAGLADWADLPKKLCDQRYRHEVSEILARAFADCRELGGILPGLEGQKEAAPGSGKARFDLVVRILFSCLVDADRLDSASRNPVQAALCADERLNMLLQHLVTLQSRSPDGLVKQMREKVLEDCLHAATAPQKLF
ncbi:MAG: CRISPR-associated endonuclease Cas3'', partial [Acidobacteriaceae bacterium]